MRFMKRLSRRITAALGVALVLVAAPGTFAAAEPPAASKAEPKDKVEVMEKTGRGRFVSYKDGRLTVRANSGSLLVWNKIAEDTNALLFDQEVGKFQPATAAALNKAKGGAWIQVIIDKGKTTVRIGERKGLTTGTFVSYKNDRLLILGKDLGASYVQKYGNNVHFNKFRDDVPAFESIDGGEFKAVGTANKVLGSVKEGTVIRVHGEGDDNITRVEIGAPKVPAPAPDKVAPKDKLVRGWFVSFEDGVLAVATQNNGVTRHKLPVNTKTFLWNHDERRSNPMDTAEAMKQLKALGEPVSATHVDTAKTLIWRKAGTGLVVQINDDSVTIRIGETKTPAYVGTFVSFKDDSLFFRLKNPSLHFQKTYGDTVKFLMNETICVYESIDGGEYKYVGTPRTVLSNVKEGTIVTVFHNYKTETDEFHLVLIGVKKK